MINLDQAVENLREDLLKSTQEILRIPSVKGAASPGEPFGSGVAQALDYALTLSKKLGFRTKNFDGYIGHAEYGEGSEILGILVHLDVVPEGSGWSHPPYGAEISDGRIYGRGSIDDKGPAIAALYALKAVKDAGVPLTKKIRILFGCDEESGWKDIDYYREREKMPDIGFSPDAEFPVINTEKGIAHLLLSRGLSSQEEMKYGIKEIKGGTRANVVPEEAICRMDGRDKERVMPYLTAFQKKYGEVIQWDDGENGEFVIRTSGQPAHGSTPEKGKNAIGLLLLFLDSLELGGSSMEQSIHFLAERIGMDFSGQGLGAAFQDEVSGKLTLNLGIIEMNPDRMNVTLDIRYPVQYQVEDILNAITHTCSPLDIEISLLSGQAPLHVGEDHFLVQKLMEVYTQLTGQKAFTIAIGGGTYARALKNGVAFGPLFPGKTEMAHQKDEYIDIEDLLLSSRIYAHAIWELAK